MLTDRDLSDDEGYTAQEVVGLCFLAAAVLHGQTSEPRGVVAKRLARHALQMAPIVGEAIRTGSTGDTDD